MHLNTLEIIGESKKLLDNQHFSASVIYSFIAVENILRDLILRPLVWGTFIDEEVASLITNSILNNRLDQISNFIFHFIKESISLDIRTLTRLDQTTPLWQEINEFKSLRNRIVHKGAKCDEGSAIRAFVTAEYLYNDIFLRVLSTAGFKIDRANRIIH